MYVQMQAMKKIKLLIGVVLAAAIGMLHSHAASKRALAPATGDSVLLQSGISSLAQNIYQTASLQKAGLAFAIFQKAIAGYHQLKAKGLITNEILTIADLSCASGSRRLYIIHMATGQLLKHTLVAHGRNSGDRLATRFSNQPSSLQSSLGFYITAGTYTGSNGYSLQLIGLEKGINDNARTRAIVMHGAPYVNEQLARSGRIGRSWGCPAVPQAEHREIIDWIKGGSCLFIYAPQPAYLSQSALLRANTLL